jgi:Raf kinase inhibitor-like YbhB/YbcL family protein
MGKSVRRIATLAIVIAVSATACSSGAPESKTATSSPAESAAGGAPASGTDSGSRASASGDQPSAMHLAAPAKPVSTTPITVTSTTFQPDASLPTSMEFDGCGGRNQSPQLTWSNFPPTTKSFVVTLFDPDAPTGTGFWHWVVFDVPASVTSLPTGAGSNGSPAARAKSGYTDFAFSHYGGPCPPNGDPAHHYIFTVYALDVPALEGVGPRSTAATVMFSLRGHLLAQGSLEGRFKR